MVAGVIYLSLLPIKIHKANCHAYNDLQSPPPLTQPPSSYTIGVGWYWLWLLAVVVINRDLINNNDHDAEHMRIPLKPIITTTITTTSAAPSSRW